jgi:ATP-dependent DNA ligase
MPPVKPMLAKPVAEIPPGRLYEPKWDGFPVDRLPRR